MDKPELVEQGRAPMLLTGLFLVSGRKEPVSPTHHHKQLHQTPFCVSAQIWASLEEIFLRSVIESRHATGAQAKLLARRRTQMTQRENEVKVNSSGPSSPAQPTRQL